MRGRRGSASDPRVRRQPWRLAGALTLGIVRARRPPRRVAGSRRPHRTAGWTASATSVPTGPDTPGGQRQRHLVLGLLRVGRLLRRGGLLLGHRLGPAAPRGGDERDVVDRGGAASLERHRQHGGEPDARSPAPRSVSCVAVGFYDDTTGGFAQHALIETLADGHWTPLDAPVPPDGQADPNYSASLQSIDCQTAQSCMRRRQLQRHQRQWRPVRAHRHRKRGQPGVRRPRRNRRLRRRTSRSPCWTCRARCVGPCAATGSYEAGELPADEPGVPAPAVGGRGRGRPRTCRFRRGRAPDANAVQRRSSGDFVRGASARPWDRWSCRAASSSGCSNSSRTARGHRRWRPVPSNAGPGGVGLNGVSCTFDGICTAVGSYNDPDNGGLPLIDTVDGATVTATEGPQPADTATGLGQRRHLNAVVVSVRHGLRGRRLLPQQHELGHGRGPHRLARPVGTWSAPTIAAPAGAGTGASASSTLDLGRAARRAAPARPSGTTPTRRATGSGCVESYIPPRGLLVGGLRRRHLHLRPSVRPSRARWAASHLNAPMVGMAATPGGGGLLGGGLRRRHLQLRQRRLPRLDGQPAPQRPDGGHGRHARRGRLLAGGLRRRHLQLRRRRRSTARPGRST